MIESVTRRLSSLTAVLAFSIAVGTAWVAVRCYSPVPFADEWQIALDLVRLNFQYPLTLLWTQHNEHRIPFQKLLEFAQLYWFRGDHAFMFVLSAIVQAAHWTFIVLFLKRSGRLSPAFYVTAAAIAAFTIFNPLQMQIFLWGFGPSFLGAFLCVTISLSALARFAVDDRDGTHGGVWIATAMGAAFLAECNLASGVLVWTILPVAGWLMGVRRRTLAVLIAGGIGGIGIYLIGYKTPSNATSPLAAIRNPGAVFAFLQAYFGESWHFLSRRVGDVLAVFGLAAFVVATATLVTRRLWRRNAPLTVWAWSIAACMFLTGFVTALGRQGYGLGQAREGRYQTAATLFWFAMAMLIVFHLRDARSYGAFGLGAQQVLASVLMAAEALHFPDLLRAWSLDAFAKNTAGLAIQSGVYDEPAIRCIYPGPEVMIPAYRTLRERGLMGPLIRGDDQIGRPVAKVFKVGNGCDGGADYVRVIDRQAGVNSIVQLGWAAIDGNPGGIWRVFGAGADGRILGMGVANAERWQMYAKTSASLSSWTVYAVKPDRKSACILPFQKSLE